MSDFKDFLMTIPCPVYINNDIDGEKSDKHKVLITKTGNMQLERWCHRPFRETTWNETFKRYIPNVKIGCWIDGWSLLPGLDESG